MLAWPAALTGITQAGQLDGKPDPVDRASLCPCERQVIIAGNVVFGRKSGASWSVSTPSASGLCRGSLLNILPAGLRVQVCTSRAFNRDRALAVGVQVRWY